MSKDIHKWTDGRYTLMFDEHTFFVWDNEKEERMTALNVTKKLNEQQSTIEQLQEELELAAKNKPFSRRKLEEENEQLDKENKKLQEEIEELKRERDDWKSSTCSYMNKDSVLSMDCQIVQEALWELEKEIEFGSKREDLFFDLKEKFEKLNNHRIGVFE